MPARPYDRRMDDLQRIVAERACERLLVDYCRLVDFGQASRIANLFTEDGRWEGTDLVLGGREEIRAWFTKREQLTRRVSRHLCTNVGVDVLSASEAESRCFLVNYRHDRAEGDLTMPAPMAVPKFVGELHDTFRRTHDGWRFASRRVDVAFARARGGGAPRT
ncbi:MAG: nuclear transport factor 2 family protein [Solirubrobacterales bacterium]|nr:nuclear transport factor 2 family protein [Solirubrobacterales bacterium]